MDRLQQFYANVDTWWYCWNMWEETGDVNFLRQIVNPDGKSNKPLLDHLESRIFNATLRRGIPLNDDEKAWLASEARNAIQVDVIYA